MKAMVQLADSNWYPCIITGKRSSCDYDGFRYDVKLTAEAIIKIADKKAITYSDGFKFYGCHRDCIRVI